MAKNVNPSSPDGPGKGSRPPDFKEALKPLFAAFKKSETDGFLTRKMLAGKSGLKREGDIGDVFRFLKGETTKEPSAFKVRKIYKCIHDYWEVDAEGFLVEKTLETRPQKNVNTKTMASGIPKTGPVIAHKNYNKINIGAAIKEDGPTIRIINTYLSTGMYNAELTEDDENALQNWLHQGKKIKLLLLIPDGKAMRLRTKADLKIDGTTLSEMIMMRLRGLLNIQNSQPDQMEVRLMDELPGVSAVILEKRLFFGLHYSFGHSENGTYFEINDPNHQGYKDISRHFDTFWNDEERSLPLSQALIDKTESALNVVRNVKWSLHNSRWRLSMHNLQEVVQNKSAAPFQLFIDSISCWDLEIKKPERGIYLQAILTVPGLAQLLKANIVTEKLYDRYYAHIRFSDFNSVSIHLTFDCKQDAHGSMMGYAIINSGKDSCAGYMVMQNYVPDEAGNLTTKELNKYYERLLRFRDGSYMSLKRVGNDKEKLAVERWAGTYKIYSYGGEKRKNKFIKVNWLRIDKSGIASYKNQRIEKLQGRATYIDSNIHFVFTYYKHEEEQKRSYMIVTVGNNDVETGSYFSGVHLGVTWVGDMPVGKRFVLEYVPEQENTLFENLPVEKIVLHTQAYKNLKPELRKLLSGRIKNLLGFLRKGGRIYDYVDIQDEWKASIELDEVFYDSAMQYVKRENYKKSVEMLFRAVNHGFDSIKRFEVEVEKDYPGALKQIREIPDYEKILKVLSGSSDIEGTFLAYDPSI